VPRRWAYDYPRAVTALLFGVGLGVGFSTRVLVPTFYLLVLWPFLLPAQPVVAIALWGAYGLARTLHVGWLAWTAPGGDLYPHVNRLTIGLLQRSGWMYRVNALLMGVASAWLAFRGAHG
jgi:hypothetical protein